MVITKVKNEDVIEIALRDTSMVWVMNPVSQPEQVEKYAKEGVKLILFSLENEVATAEDLQQWDITAQELKKKGVILVYSPGEYQIHEAHLKGSSLDTKTHYYIETAEGTIGLFSSKPSDAFVKQYAPIDVLIGKDVYLAESQLDFEPFYVILPSVSEEYTKKAGVSEVTKAPKVTIKKIDASSRGTASTTEVYALS